MGIIVIACIFVMAIFTLMIFQQFLIFFHSDLLLIRYSFRITIAIYNLHSNTHPFPATLRF